MRNLALIILIFQVLNQVRGNSGSALLTETEQRTKLDSLFREWTRRVEAQPGLRDILTLIAQNPEANACPKSTVGINALLRKMDAEAVEVISRGRSTGANPTSTLSQLEAIKTRANFLREEWVTEGPSRCRDAFNTSYASLQNKIRQFEGGAKDSARKEHLELLVQGIGLGDSDITRAVIRDVDDTDELVFLIESVLNDIASTAGAFTRGFPKIVWFLTEFGGHDRRLTDSVVNSTLAKLSSFNLITSQHTIRLASLARRFDVSQEVKQKFPLQIQNLIWGRVLCIKNFGNGMYLREVFYPGSTRNNNDNLDVPLEIVVLREESLNRMEELCGWILLPLESGRDLKFRLERKVDDPEKHFGLVTRGGSSVVLSSRSSDEKIAWTANPVFSFTPVRENAHTTADMSFTFNFGGPSQRSLCQYSAGNSTASGQSRFPVSLHIPLEGHNACNWILERIL